MEGAGAAALAPAVRLTGVTKRYGPVVACAGVDLELREVLRDAFQALGEGLHLGRADLAVHQHQQLARMFASTRWAGGKWSEDLARLKGAIRPDDPVKLMSGTKVRCVVIPPDLLPSSRDEGTAGDTD